MQRQIRKTAILPPLYFSWIMETSAANQVITSYREFPLDVFRHIKDFLLIPPLEWNQIQATREKKSEIRILFTKPSVCSRYNRGLEYNDFNNVNYEFFSFAIYPMVNIQLHCCCYCGEFVNTTCHCMTYSLHDRVYRIDTLLPTIEEDDYEDY